jgi:hypothetical protein
MNFWLDLPCKKLTDDQLLAEHEALHHYFKEALVHFREMLKDRQLGPYDPMVLWHRHNEQVRAFETREFIHDTPIQLDEALKIWQSRMMLSLGHGCMLTDEGIKIDQYALETQDAFLLRRGELELDGEA